MGNKKNQRVRKELEEEYGKGCMFKKAGCEQKIKRIRGIKTYKQFKEEKRYTLKFIEHYEGIMTLHHLKHVEEGRRNNKGKRSYSKCFRSILYAQLTKKPRRNNKRYATRI